MLAVAQSKKSGVMRRRRHWRSCCAGRARWFLARIATHILAAEGESKWTFFDGNYQEYEADKKKRLGEEGAKPKRIRFKPLK